MAIPPVVKESEGRWAGRSILHLPWLADGKQVQESPSQMTIELDPQGAFATLRYSWEYEGEIQSGQMIICASSESDKATVGWSDSWHQSASVMFLSGTGAQGGALVVAGEYEVESHPNWGWRIEFHRPDSSDCFIKMVNIDPNGPEEWAVEARYTRA